MTLTLTMLRCPDQVAPEMREVRGGEYSIGRGAENDWILADPERFLSKQHCVLAFRSGGWQIADVSTNGTFLNRDSDPIGRAARDLNDGDRLRLGPYEIEVRVSATQPARQHPTADPFAFDPFAAPRGQTDNPFAIDPAAAPHPASPFEGDRMLVGRQAEPFMPGQVMAPPSVSLPADYEPLSPDQPDPFIGPTGSDHSPHLGDAFRAPRATLPDDWDRDLLAAPFPPPPAPLTQPDPPPDVFAASAPPLPSPPAAAPLPVPTMAAPLAAAAPLPAPPMAAPLPAASADLLAAFLRGAGVEDARPGDPVAAMTGLGAAMRATVSGLRQALIARALVKSEFRIEQTMIRRSGNNPLKFSADDDDALIALLGAGRHTDMTAPEAIADALRDIHLHELATMQAMQAALRKLLGEFLPDKLREAAGKGGLDFTAVQTKARAWDTFVAQHGRIVAALSDDFDSVFGRAFAQAYEQALAEVAEQRAAQ